jgi:hypothetical protein
MINAPYVERRGKPVKSDRTVCGYRYSPLAALSGGKLPGIARHPKVPARETDFPKVVYISIRCVKNDFVAVPSQPIAWANLEPAQQGHRAGLDRPGAINAHHPPVGAKAEQLPWHATPAEQEETAVGAPAWQPGIREIGRQALCWTSDSGD